ncbi:MAG: hypothetical protein ABF461_03765 [Zymomonas mobilis subsp. pomaceae]|uniref:Uncharacterized protein n=1 Tax=Zymomonas mobilis subsp. pomaceae (strain ATCC 29192 / DSM 22645 / JCM 10191 / CCUG 17912 / NBRC 13757 / NCIMB 11200 / NRRL B-4491 / Barker I) TaxID=579138 RepID=F8ETS7_ZYMMT|nr:hypothetical protein Zymop_1128 [Zymomonas mobilis subsp. pomaceae ATCC 29192]GEB89134.1 hypothetical protein ZMO02_07710 [Zymomonas mobilis subsp. pomaceae]
MNALHALAPIRDDSFAALIAHAASFFYGEKTATDFIYTVSRINEFKTYFRDFLTTALLPDNAGILLLHPKRPSDKDFDRLFNGLIEQGIITQSLDAYSWVINKADQNAQTLERIKLLIALKQKFKKKVKYLFTFELLLENAYRDKIFFVLLLLAIEYIDRSRNAQFIEDIGSIFNKDLKNTLLILIENRSYGFDKIAVFARDIDRFPSVFDKSIFINKTYSIDHYYKNEMEEVILEIKTRNINQILLAIASIILNEIKFKLL